MTVLGIIGIIFAAILIIIAVILILPVYIKLNVSKSGVPVFSVSILGIKLFANKKNKKPAEKKSLPKKKKSVTELINSVIDTVKTVLHGALWLIGKMRIKKLRLSAVCASDDAAEAALDYGAACAVAYPVKAIIEDLGNCDKNAVSFDIRCDFNSTAPVFDFNATVSVRVIYILCAAIIILKDSFSNIAEVNTDEGE